MARSAERRRSPSNLGAARARMYHELVLESAERVFAAKGFGRSTMQDVAAEAGVSLKTVYSTIEGKEQLHREIHEVRTSSLVSKIHAAASRGTALERLEDAVRATVDFMLDHPDFFRILLDEGVAWGVGPRLPESRALWLASSAHTLGILHQGIDEGVFHAGDPEILVASVQSIMQAVLAIRIERDEASDRTAIADEILDQLRRLLCKAPVPVHLHSARSPQ